MLGEVQCKVLVPVFGIFHQAGEKRHLLESVVFIVNFRKVVLLHSFNPLVKTTCKLLQKGLLLDIFFLIFSLEFT
jgi:hypothetical protein